MEQVVTIAQARALFDVSPRPLGFVPTMGAIHEGHLELVRRARTQCAAVAVSVFVNPLQFGPSEDLAAYPRDLEGDRAKLAAAGADVLFAPETATMYPDNFTTSVDVGWLATIFEGAIRPAHFRGVATVVAKLLHVVRPDVLYLGQKDAQQTAVLRAMIRDLEFETRVAIVPTVREPDGLAMSSRNAYLDAAARAQAPTLYRALLAMREALDRGDPKREAIATATAALSPAAELDYLELVDGETFGVIDRLRAPAFIIGAARFDGTRLIDNLWISS
jgi:pantoate--beta-alanine ligase